MGNNATRRDFVKGAGVAMAMGGAIAAAPIVARAEEVAWDDECDILVVGGGTGLVGACRAADNGDDVLLIEKMSFCGGAAALNEGLITVGGGTNVQKAAGVEDTFQEWHDDTWAKDSASRIDVDVWEATIAASTEACNYVFDECDLPVVLRADTVLAYDYAHPRIHAVQPGSYIWGDHMSAQAEKRGVRIRCRVAMTDFILNEDGEVIGIEADDLAAGTQLRIKAKKAVLLASGDCANNEHLKADFYSPEVAAVKASAAGDTGDGLLAGMRIGADVAMGSTWSTAWPSWIPEGSSPSPWWVQKANALIVNGEGKRIGDEFMIACFAGGDDPNGVPRLMLRDVAEGKETFAMVFDSVGRDVSQCPGDALAMVDAFKAGTSMAIGLLNGHGTGYFDEYEEAGTIVQADTLEELAEQVGIDPAGLAQTVESWRAATAVGVDEEFGRTPGTAGTPAEAFGEPSTLDNPPYFAIVFRPELRWCNLDGPNLVVNPQYQIMGYDGEPIPRLYGCGWVSAGIRGYQGSSCGLHMMYGITSNVVAADNAHELAAWE